MSAAASDRRTTNMDSCVAGAWGRPSSSMRGSQGRKFAQPGSDWTMQQLQHDRKSSHPSVLC
jgi:hypothetical protein